MSNNFSKYDDKELVVMVANKGKDAEQAFKEIYNRYASDVNAYSLKITGNVQQAEDIFQETFIRFYQKVNYIDEKTNVPGYLITIARNLCLNLKRDKKVMVPIDDYVFAMPENKTYENDELLNLINYALDLLDYEFREAFILKEYNGLKYEELAELIGISVNNAKSRVFRAKKRIREILQPYLKDLCK